VKPEALVVFFRWARARRGVSGARSITALANPSTRQALAGSRLRDSIRATDAVHPSIGSQAA
jgi:hypothetical protein